MSRGLRVKKSRSMIWSLYGLSGLAAVAYIALSLLVLLYLFSHIEVNVFLDVFQVFLAGFYFISLSMTLSFPFAFALSFFIILKHQSQFSLNLQKMLNVIDQSPLLISGVFFLVFFGGGWLSLYLTCSFLAISKLSYRWIKLTNSVPRIQIETAQSIGMNIWQIVNLLYIRKFMKMYLGHYLSVACFLFAVVTPFVCILNYSESERGLFSVDFFKHLGEGTATLSMMALFLLLIHWGRVWFDSRAFYTETEHG